MTSPEIRRILETCLNHNGQEVWLLAGRPPLLRFRDSVRELVIGWTLSADDIANLILGSSASAKAFWREQDFYRFDWRCDWREARFRLFLVRHGKLTMATLTPIPLDAPELEYAPGSPGGG